MRLPLRLTAFVVLVAVALGTVGCGRARPRQPWKAADEQLAVTARAIAEKAKQNDVTYFRGLVVDRARVFDLIESVARSGIASNYAEHLEVVSDSAATLVYRQEGDLVTATPFSIQLTLHDGSPRVDQIIIGEYNREVAARLGPLFEPTVSSEMTVPPRVSVAIAPGRLIAGSEQSALISYANTLDEDVWVSQPLSSQVIIISTAGQRVWEWGPFRALDSTGSVRLAPFESTYEVVRFTAPEPGTYLLFGRAKGTLSQATKFTTIEK